MSPQSLAGREMTILAALVQTMSVFLVFFYLYCQLPFLTPLKTFKNQEPGLRGQISLYVFCTVITIFGSYSGIWLPGGVVANTRAVGATLAGLLGGPVLGLAVGATAGLHRLTLGGFTASSGALGTVVDSLLGGLVHVWYRRRPDRLADWRLAFGVTALGETLHMGFVLLISRPFEASVVAVETIGGPMILANSLGVALFMLVVRDRNRFHDEVAAASSAKALRIAQRTLGMLSKGFPGELATSLASIVREETGVGAVAVTDTEKVLSFSGLGADHHLAGAPIASRLTRRALAEREVVFTDGVHESYRCTLSPTCPLASALVVPLEVDGAVIGTVQLFEPHARRFGIINKSLGEGIAALLSSQILVARYQEQKSLLTMAELKLIHAQVNPHFLFNSLNTIIAITRTDPERARELLTHLSQFFRKNLKRQGELSTLEEELAHVGSYLEIEKARFQGRLVVELSIPAELMGVRLPTFTLQPLIENAIKHGLSSTLGPATTRIRARVEAGLLHIDIEDDAGAFAPGDGTGLGMKIVDRRIKNLAGDAYGVSVSCVPEQLTRVRVTIPAKGLGP
jgi:two-component system, LytTR family, sensor kinase